MKKIKLKLSDSLIFFLIGLLIGGALVYVYYQSNDSVKGSTNIASIEAAAYLKFKEIRESLTPSGVPEIYGRELGLSFDKVQESIDIMVVFGPTYGQEGKKIILAGSDLERYKKIGASIACEYCCGIKTLTKKDGSAACGCAHSIMMRALAAYLIKEHPKEFTDKKILQELEKWKITFFPKQTLVKKLQKLEKAGEPGIKEILEEFPEFMPSMVGGC